MSFTIPPILVYIASWLGMMGGVWGLFDRAEKVVDPKAKEKISNWLLTAKVPIDERWPATFENLSVKVFGKKLISIRSFLISSLFSMLTVILLSPIWYLFRPQDFNMMMADEGNVLSLFGFLMFMFCALNIVQDYLSVIQTRFLLRKMIQAKSTLMGQWAFLCLENSYFNREENDR